MDYRTHHRTAGYREHLFIYLGFYVAFNTVQVISRWVVGRAEETSTYSSSGFCPVNCRTTASNYQLSHLRPCRRSNPGLRGGRRECYHSPPWPEDTVNKLNCQLQWPGQIGYYCIIVCTIESIPVDCNHYFQLLNKIGKLNFLPFPVAT